MRMTFAGLAGSAAVAALAAAAAVVLSGDAFARDQIRIVGSSTVYPFTTAVAEQFGKTGAGKTPVVESTGTGGGMKLFCAGVGEAHPDLTNASRAMKKGEFEDCQKNGVKDIVEIKVGIDGITLAQSKAGPAMKLTMEQVFLALADLQKSDAKAFEKVWKSIRKDGAYVEAGENDNVIVQKLEANKNAFGIFGYSFLEENTAKLKGVPIDGAEATYDNISSGKYKGARPLFVYVKKQHVGVIPGIDKFVAEYVSSKALSKDGYLARKGLVALPKGEIDKVMAGAKEMKVLSASDVH